MRVHVLALRDCTAIVSVGMLELLRKSLQLTPRPRQPVEVQLVGAEREVVSAGGLVLRCDATLDKVHKSDLVIVPPLDPDVVEHLQRNQEVVPWLKRLYARGADVASACTGAFILGEAGLLDGKSATTHWAFQSLLAARHPRLKLEPQAIVVDQGRVCTAGGATSFINLTLFLVERLLGAEVARMASRMFLIDMNKAPQGAYAMFTTQKLHDDDPILRAQTIIEDELHDVPSVDALARRVAMSRRTFVRRFRRATGNAPRDYIQRVRIEAAKRALEEGRSVGEIAERVGYGDPVAFRKLFVRLTGLLPTDYRARYGPASRPSLVRPGKRARSA
jgi:transcriptional regulator GlxA family with amidase domain